MSFAIIPIKYGAVAKKAKGGGDSKIMGEVKKLNKINHIFKNKLHNHGLDDLVKKYGNRLKAYEKIESETIKKINTWFKLNDILIEISI